MPLPALRCAAACLATIAKQNGYGISISKIREIAGTDKQGTNAYGVIKAAEEFFGEVATEGKPPKYQWTGVLILLVKNETFQKGNETQGLFERFFSLLIPQKKLLLHIFAASLLYTIHGYTDEKMAVFRRRHMGFVFQQYNLLEEYNVQKNICIPLELDGKK